MEKIKIKHQLIKESFFIPDWEIKYLFLGTFNPEGGDKVHYFYGRERNQTWKLLSEIFMQELNPKHNDFLEKIQRLGIACMDMIQQVEIDESNLDYVIGKGYSDTKIINNNVDRIYNTNSIIEVLKVNSDVILFSTWGKGSNLAEWTQEISKLAQIHEIKNLVSPSMVARVPAGKEKFQYMLNDWKKQVGIGYNSVDLDIQMKVAGELSQKQSTKTNQMNQSEKENIIFEVEIKPTYFKQPFFNIKKKYDSYFGKDCSELSIILENSNKIITKHVDRTTNLSHAPRIYVGMDYLKWIQNNFKVGDYMKVEVLPNATIRLSK